MNIDGNNIISASGVREAIKKDKMDEIKNMVPECTYKFFSSEEGKNIELIYIILIKINI